MAIGQIHKFSISGAHVLIILRYLRNIEEENSLIKSNKI